MQGKRHAAVPVGMGMGTKQGRGKAGRIVLEGMQGIEHGNVHVRHQHIRAGAVLVAYNPTAKG